MIQADKIRKWASDRGLDKSDKAKQLLKLNEESGEAAEAFLKGDKEGFVDGLGDIFVVITIVAQQHGLKIEDCIDMAYEEIANRNGKMVDGTYLKDADQKEALHGSQK